ncbi:dinitrogenase iron-molybdenum cofactor biosynthesis protein [Clostridium sp. 19966]|uniref:NifB/NifX family molybdenum-iron cluster-binding protein n=1 Tax=Clostridium sp. 19966 TaxID=2768166 RepID=UPI0028DF97BC|nr:NifB/NifX family molybdenum-iron cluster-binding protein [Clostridium sp. 19966]MDT8717858.1 dinitrogenase iron-molybdenum cofactor biosynthesis protein [Clostridium sp. 19966]
MHYKVAFASSDGELVNKNFIKANKFIIYEIGDNTAKYLEERTKKRVNKRFENSEDILDKYIKGISDCRAIFVDSANNNELQVLKSRGIKVFNQYRFINEVIGKILSSTLEI